jgi:hypothetical protein
MVEQVVGSGQRCAPSTSPVRRCSLPVSVVLQVEAACQQRDVVAASAAPAATMALAGVAAEKEARGLEKGLASGISQLFLGRWREGPGWPREDTGGRARCLGQCKPGANFDQGWVRSDTSDRMCHTAGEGAGDASVWSDQFGCALTRCVGLLEMPLHLDHWAGGLTHLLSKYKPFLGSF